MKTLVASLFIFLPGAVIAQHHTLEKLWETDSVVAVPESVLPYAKKHILFISLIDGGGWVADGKGGIAQLSPDGKNYDSSWITGLNAPKGLGIYGDYLYVADIAEVAVINISTGKIEKKIPIDSATGLNDITIDDKGIVYVSDSRKARIWRIENGRPSLYLDNVKGVNGLKAAGDDLLIGAGTHFSKADKNKAITTIAEISQSIDGIEPVGRGDYIVTAWAGYIFYVYADGRVDPLLDTHNEKKNTADIGYDPAKKILFVPEFNAKRVAAYLLK